MCTLTYVPFENDGFILTSNRDEIKSRKKASFPHYMQSKRSKVTFPKDGDAGGSWIAASDELVVCLLNGAYEVHQRKDKYALSRGLVLLEAFQYANAEEFIENFDFSGIEAFTMILLDLKKKDLTEFVWDEVDKYIKHPKMQEAQIWSSVPLYSEEERREKKQLFIDYLKSNPNPGTKELRVFHKFEGDGTKPAFLLSRNNLINTVSITSVHRLKEQVKMEYEDMS